MNSVFSEQILADKLSKLNSTQQCIETLSHWCIFHRSKAELVITTWDKQFHSSDMAQKVPLLYLANDILQNSKRKGNEFVNEFWKVLPAALKDVSDNGDDNGKKVVSRLVNIWEDRRVFGSQRSLKDVMLGAELPPPLELSKKRPRSVRILKRDSRSIKTKLSIGGAAEKIVSAFHLVFTEHPIEDAEMSKCKSAVNRVRKLEKDVDAAYTNVKDPNRKTLAKEIEEDENLLQQCIEKLKSVEANRLVLVDQLKEALHDQESEIENIRTQMQVAQAQIEEASIMRKRLNDENYVGVSKLSNVTASTNTNAKEGHGTKRTAAALAAEVADKLTASSSSQLIMSSVLSTFAAEEAKNAGLAKSTAASNSFTSIPSNSANDSMSKSEKQMQVSNSNVFMIAQPQPAPLNHQYQSVLVNQPTMQSQAQVSQAQYHMTANNSSQQYVQQSGAVLNPYGYGSIPPLPAGPPPQHPQSHLVTPMVPSAQQPLQMGHQQPMALAQQQPPVAPSFRPLQPPSLVYYAHPH